MLKVKPITREQYDMALMRQSVTDAIASIPTPSNGRDGAKGASGKDGADGVTTTVTREVLANKEKLLTKEEFEEFKKLMVRMENDVRDSLAQSHNYFPGGGGGITELVNLIEVSTDVTIRDSQLRKDRFNVVLAMVAGITITLPTSNASKIVWVQQGYEGSGEFTVCKQ